MGNYIDGVNGVDFANEMEYLQNAGVEKINVRINSGGGSVLDGYAIITSILNSKVKVDTYIDGLAASMAATIAVCGKKTYMADYGTFMIHEAKGEDEKIAALFTNTINTILTNRTGKSTEDIAAMMKKETWLDAEGCKVHGFIDEIVNTGIRTKKPSATASVEEKFAVYNEIITKPKNNMKDINASLKLAENATEVEAVNAINSKEAELAALKIENAAFKAEKAAAEVAKKEALKTKATALGEKAFADKKIAEEEKAPLIENASSSEAAYSLVENMLNKISTTKVAEKVLPENAMKVLDEKRASWSWTDWSKNDPKGLDKMQNESPALFELLYNKEFPKKETK